jgi:hypothetical protein
VYSKEANVFIPCPSGKDRRYIRSDRWVKISTSIILNEVREKKGEWLRATRQLQLSAAKKGTSPNTGS